MKVSKVYFFAIAVFYANNGFSSSSLKCHSLFSSNQKVNEVSILTKDIHINNNLSLTGNQHVTSYTPIVMTTLSSKEIMSAVAQVVKKFNLKPADVKINMVKENNNVTILQLGDQTIIDNDVFNKATFYTEAMTMLAEILNQKSNSVFKNIKNSSSYAYETRDSIQDATKIFALKNSIYGLNNLAKDIHINNHLSYTGNQHVTSYTPIVMTTLNPKEIMSAVSQVASTLNIRPADLRINMVKRHENITILQLGDQTIVDHDVFNKATFYTEAMTMLAEVLNQKSNSVLKNIKNSSSAAAYTSDSIENASKTFALKFKTFGKYKAAQGLEFVNAVIFPRYGNFPVVLTTLKPNMFGPKIISVLNKYNINSSDVKVHIREYSENSRQAVVIQLTTLNHSEDKPQYYTEAMNELALSLNQISKSTYINIQQPDPHNVSGYNYINRELNAFHSQPN